jgi:hypothetical protein
MEIFEIITFVLGFLILIITFFDFFHTTLSGNGFWYISGTLNEILSRIILSNKNRRFFDYSGLIHLLLTTLCWLVLLILGTYLIFISDEEMVINAQTKVPADLLERFYYTCYLLSTLGIGDFTPGHNFSRILSSALSFSGFILLTTALTYLLSVVNSVLSKRQLALTISTLGEDITELYNFFELESSSALTDKSGDLRQLILQNASNFLAFPIMNHFMTRKKSRSAEVQLASLYEVLMVLQMQYDKKTVEYAKMDKVVKAIDAYTSMGISDEDDFKNDEDHLAELRHFWTARGLKYQQDTKTDRQINASLKSAGWEWKDVYKTEN